MKNLLLISLFLLIFSSCTKILSRIYHLEQPRLETYDSLKFFLKSYRLDTSEILVFQDTTSLYRFLAKNKGIPDASFFNKNGDFVDYRSSEASCNGEVDLFINKLYRVDSLPFDNGKTLNQVLENLVYSENQKPFIVEEKNIDVFVIIYWAKYLGKLNKTKVYEWEQQIKKMNSAELKIQLIKVDLDYQLFWGLNEKDIPDFKF